MSITETESIINTALDKNPKVLSIGKELKALLALALPIMGSQLAQTANGFVDAAMAGRVSPLDLAAVAVGSSIWVPVYLFMSGILMATTPFVAQLFGAKKHEQIGEWVQQALWLSLVIGACGFFLVRNVDLVMTWLHVSPDIQSLSTKYLAAISWGMLPVAVFVVLRAYSEGIGYALPMTVISIIGLLINIPANYIFINGKLGLPAMGGEGCGWATSLVMSLMCILMALYVFLHPLYRGSNVFKNIKRPDLSYWIRLLRTGLPIGISIFIEVSVFSIVALLIGSLGSSVVASHQIALNFASMVFMLPLSIGMALTVRIGHAMGNKSAAQTKHSAYVGVAFTGVLAICLALFIASLRGLIPNIYTNDESVRLLATGLLLYAALFQIPDGLQAAALGSLRGMKDTRGPMFITLLAYWMIALPLGYVLGLGHLINLKMGPSGFWIGLLAGLTVAAILLNYRLFIRIKTISF